MKSVGKEFRYEGQEPRPPKMDGNKWFTVLFISGMFLLLMWISANPD